MIKKNFYFLLIVVFINFFFLPVKSDTLFEMGKDVFHREILYLGKAKGDLAYMEAKLQFEKEVLLRDDYYNGIIQIRIGGNSVKHLK